jgi:hypothetical protein
MARGDRANVQVLTGFSRLAHYSTDSCFDAYLYIHHSVRYRSPLAGLDGIHGSCGFDRQSSAIYPLVLIAPLTIAPALDFLHVPQNRLIVTFAVTGRVVFLMIYAVMPRYTRLLRRWLFK